MSSIREIETPRWALPCLKPCRYLAIYGGRGSGKSHFVGEYIIESHILNPNESTVCVREVQKTLDQSVKRLLEQKIEKLNAGYYFEVLDAKIRSKAGNGLITFQGMQNHTADSIKSLESYKRAWVEESQTLTQYSLDLLRPTIRIPDSQIIFTWNPRYKTDPVDKLFRKNPPPESTVIQVNWMDNPWFPDVLRKEMEYDFRVDVDKAEHIWNGAYGAGQGAILARYVNQAERDGRIHDGVAYDPAGGPVEISSDLGFRDTASWWYWQRKVGGYSLLHYEGESGWDADDWIPRIQHNLLELGCPLGKIWLPHDARAKTFQSKHSSVEKFIKGFGASKVAIVPQTKKEHQISAAREVIQRCEFNKTRCEAGLDGLMAWEFEWNEENNVFSREPLHNWASHPADAFAYGCQVMQEQVIPNSEELPRFPIQAQDNRIVTATLDELWETAPRRNNRV